MKVVFHKKHGASITDENLGRGCLVWHEIEDGGSTLDDIVKVLSTTSGITDRMPPHMKPPEILKSLTDLIEYGAVTYVIEGLNLTKCLFCNGTGVQGHEIEPCPACEGDGEVYLHQSLAYYHDEPPNMDLDNL